MKNDKYSEFDATVIRISTYFFVITVAFRWISLGCSLFSFASVVWFDRSLSFTIIGTSWFLFVCIWLVSFIQKSTLESILEQANKK